MWAHADSAAVTVKTFSLQVLNIIKLYHTDCVQKSFITAILSIKSNLTTFIIDTPKSNLIHYNLYKQDYQTACTVLIST